MTLPHTLVIARAERRPESDGVEGHLYVDGKLLGPTLERGAVAIPPGTWPVKLHHSPKFGRATVHIDCGKGWTLVHAGGIPAHSEGCVLLGANDLEGAAISGGAPLVTWLETTILGSDREHALEGPVRDWIAVVTEIGGDLADGKLV